MNSGASVKTAKRRLPRWLSEALYCIVSIPYSRK